MRNWVPKVVSKFQDDPMVNESRIIVLLKHISVYAGKREDLRKEEEKTNLREKKESRDIS